MTVIDFEPSGSYVHWLHETRTDRLRALYWLHQQLGIGEDSPWHRELLFVAATRHLGDLDTWSDATGEEWLSVRGYDACQDSAVHLSRCLETANQAVRAARRLLMACFHQLEPDRPNYGVRPFEIMETSRLSGVKFSDYGGTQWLNICICQLLFQRAAEGNMVPRPTTVAN